MQMTNVCIQAVKAGSPWDAKYRFSKCQKWHLPDMVFYSFFGVLLKFLYKNVYNLASFFSL